ncbi:MAG: hypothetical protein WC994_08200 [Brumimicrobium sp.]
MKNKIFTFIWVLIINMTALAQTPREIHQQDNKKYIDLWSSPKYMLITVAVIVGIILARYWSKKTLKKRDESKDNDKLR